ncbi:hypothetical protein B0H13DRAFT_2302305 [Mycena leptocephala]|nr:hypothetical protein B0H13DRAFT_2302305 [Mycena leptocephala]
MFLGPALLHGRLKTVYYRHFLKLVNIFNLFLKYFLPNDERDKLETAIVEWVEEYERLYYRYDDSRISACTLPIHALLHVPANIRTMRPLWCYWNFPTERFCGSTIHSRKHPFTSMAHRLRDVAQLNQLKLLHGLKDEVDLSDAREEERSGIGLPDYPDFVFVYPQERAYALDQAMKKRIASCLSTNFANNVHPRDLIHFIPDHVHAYGKIKFVGGGDTCHSMFAYKNPDGTRRDASYIKVNSFHYPRPSGPQERKLALALVSPGKLEGSRRMPAYRTYAVDETVSIDSILGLIGRVWNKSKRRWILLGRPEVMEQVDGATFAA